MSFQIDQLIIDADLREVVDTDILSASLSEAISALTTSEDGSYFLDRLELEIPKTLSPWQIKDQLPGIIRQTLASRLTHERDCGRRER